MSASAFLRRLFASLLLALVVPAASAVAQTPVRVVIFEQLMEPPPTGLSVLSNAVRQLENEFQPKSREIEMLAQQYDIARAAAEKPDEAGQQDKALVARAEQLGLDLQRKSEDAAANYQRREEAVIRPLVLEVDQALQRYGEATGSEVFLLGWQEFNAEAPGTLHNVTAAFVTWMGMQP